MYSSSQLSFIGITFLHLIHFIIAQTPSTCQSIYVRIESTSNSLDINNWNGVYSIVNSEKSFNGSIWIISNSNKWLKYIETHWVLSGLNNELLIYESNILFPPINQSSIWIHEFYNDPIQIRLDCSSSLSPTASPTPSPTALPTYSPTISDCNILIVSDSSDSNNKMNTTYFENWKYYLSSTKDFYNRPIWQYTNDNTISYVEYLNANGWIVRLNNGHSITIYASNNNKLFGNFPLLNVEILFNITTNNGLIRIFKFICISSDIPTNSPSLTPSISPTNQPIIIPNISPTSKPPTFLPTNHPTISPSIECEILKINIERNLLINNSPNCNINFEKVFNSYWLKQISKSNRPSWTLDCNDNNNEYITACNNGYSGTVFYISNQWEIQIHSKTDDCFERFIIDNTNSYFIPINKQWTDESTLNKYTFNIQCTDRMYVPTPQLTGDTFITKNKIYIYNEIWFWIAFLLILLICFILCIAAYYWNKQRKPIIINNYQPKQIKSVSHMNVSKQQLELQNTPKQAYIDHDIAPAHTQSINNNNNTKNDNEYKSNMVTDGDPHVTGSTINPNVKNPNLKNNNNNNNQSQRNIGEELKENINISDNDNIEELYDENNKEKETPVNTDQALNMIAGDRQVTGYNGNVDDGIIQDEHIDEIFSV
eukprot:294187_1